MKDMRIEEVRVFGDDDTLLIDRYLVDDGIFRGIPGWKITCMESVVTVLSMVYADPADPKDKSRMYALVQQAAEQYRSRNGGGSIICRELLAKAGAAPAGGTAAEDRTADYYKKRPCPELCRLCADLCAEFIAAHPEGRHGLYKEDA